MQKVKVKEYADQTRAERRVTLAKDVLAQLATARFRAQRQTYFRVNLTKDERGNPNGSLKDILPEKVCTVCAKGAVFAAHVLRNNEFSIGNLRDESEYGGADCRYAGSYECKRQVDDAFDDVALAKLECAFEGLDKNGAPMNSHTLGYYEAVEWSKLFPRKLGAEARLTSLMNNLVRNKGDLKFER